MGSWIKPHFQTSSSGRFNIMSLFCLASIDISSRRGCFALGTQSLSSPFILIVILFLSARTKSERQLTQDASVLFAPPEDHRPSPGCVAAHSRCLTVCNYLLFLVLSRDMQSTRYSQIWPWVLMLPTHIRRIPFMF